MNLILIGYRGTGKSAAGQGLARRLNMKRISTDEEVVRQAGMAVSQIVAMSGWSRFRELEAEVARQVSVLDNVIIDTGGGIVERWENVAALQQNGCVIWLRASVETIVSRIEFDSGRPALIDGKTFTEEVAEILERRNPLYARAAQHELVTDSLTPCEVVDRVVSLWHDYRQMMGTR